MSTKKKSKTPSMFSGLLSARNRKGNLQDLIHQFMIQDSRTSDSQPQEVEKNWNYSEKTKKVKVSNEVSNVTTKVDFQSKKMEEEVDMKDILMPFEKFQPVPKHSSPEKKLVPAREKESKEEAKIEIKVKERKKVRGRSRAKAQSSSQKSSPKKKKGKTYEKKSKGPSERELEMYDVFPFDDNATDDADPQSDLPYWLQSEHIKDAAGRRLDEEDYDPTTLFIPPTEFEQLPSVQKKYWEFKCRYFDKIVAFKMWQSHFLYGNDALLLHKICDTPLGYHRGRIYTHCSDRLLLKNASKLLDHGHKILILKPPPDYQYDETYEKHTREVSQILTRGTFIDHPDLTYASVFCLCIFERMNNIGIVFLDSTTHEFYIGEFKDDIAKNNLRTIVNKIKPVEVVYMRNYLSQESKDVLNSLPTRPTFTQVQMLGERTRSISSILEEIAECFVLKDNSAPVLPELIDQIKNAVELELKHSKKNKEMTVEEEMKIEEGTSNYFTVKALSLCYNYLKELMLVENIFALGTFEPYDIAIEKRTTLYLDNQALQNLEILEAEYMHKLREDRSLFGYMDRTASAFGKRMFRKWLISPLLDVNMISERQQAIEDLMNNSTIADYFQSMIKDLPDIERTISKVYNLASKKKIANERFQEFIKNKLLEFLNVLEQLEKVEAVIERFGPHIKYFKSKRLTQLTTFKNLETNSNTLDEGLFPKVGPILTELKKMVLIKDGLLVPAPGIDEEVDRILGRIDELKADMLTDLEEQKRFFQYRYLKFSHTKQKYEIEVPEEIFERIPRPAEYAITSKRKGIIRIHTPRIEQNLAELTTCEFDLNNALSKFIHKYFLMFYEKKAYWHQIVSCLSELDCLCGLAKFTKTMKSYCRPVVLPQGDKPIFELKDMIHPCVALINPNFVPNDFIVENGLITYLITGPNMGGKSTLLRQICIAVIMAQVGSFVPASSFRFSVIDRIFTRIGASDRIMEGKSTFFVELEETYTIVTEATRHSLVIVDELGRGTSTYDGVSIAYATLKYIAEKIECVTLFATHYHLLLEEFKLYKNIVNYHMESELNSEKEEIEFKYRFVKGQSDRSHGVIIAKMAGISQEACRVAKERSEFMTNERRNIGFQKSLTDRFNKMIEELEKFENGNNANIDSEKILEEIDHL